jgi:hypothetical protein
MTLNMVAFAVESGEVRVIQFLIIAGALFGVCQIEGVF